jgi:hypothetical protein
MKKQKVRNGIHLVNMVHLPSMTASLRQWKIQELLDKKAHWRMFYCEVSHLPA